MAQPPSRYRSRADHFTNKIKEIRQQHRMLHPSPKRKKVQKKRMVQTLMALRPPLDSLHTFSPENVVQETSHKTFPFSTRWQQLRQQICFIVVRVHIGSSPLIMSTSLPHKVLVRNALTLLLQDRVRNSSVCQNRLVVTFNVDRSLYRNPSSICSAALGGIHSIASQQ